MENKIPEKRFGWFPPKNDLANLKNKARLEKNTEAERMATFLLRREDWSVKSVGDIRENHNLELYKYNQKVATQVRNQKQKVSIGQVEKFLKFLNHPNSKDFTGGYIISASGFTPSVYSYIRKENIDNLKLAILRDTKLIWNCEELETQIKKEQPTYIGVFTCKGGVGKTTIAAHLAGAFAMNGYDVELIDLDKQRNLQKLLGNKLNVSTQNNEVNSIVNIWTPKHWKEKENQKNKIVICDCNPEFEANPIEFVRKFDYCIIPTTLNPLGINRNADVIKRTFEAIRYENESSSLFVLINSLFADEDKRNKLLNQTLKVQFKKLVETDEKCHYIDPNEVAIRFSKQLLYWGYHIIEQTSPTLAFRSVGGYSYPLMDFLKLADYLENHTEIENPIKSRAAKLVGF